MYSKFGEEYLSALKNHLEDESKKKIEKLILSEEEIRDLVLNAVAIKVSDEETEENN